jgi:hypothetical protein
MDSDNETGQGEYKDRVKPQYGNPLLRDVNKVIEYVEDYKERAKSFYYEVILSPYACPRCNGALRMTGMSQCACACGNIFDPTLAFQTSPCCKAKLMKKTFHYSCAHCHETTSSRFLFYEKLFDKEYFREMMREYRHRSSGRKEEIRRLLAESRSRVLTLMEEPNLESIPDLIQDLDSFIQAHPYQALQESFDLKSDFNIGAYHAYRTHILSSLSGYTMRFSDVSPLMDDCRRDKVRRFITLLFMDNDQEIDVQQYGNDLLIQRRDNEAYAEG